VSPAASNTEQVTHQTTLNSSRFAFIMVGASVTLSILECLCTGLNQHVQAHYKPNCDACNEQPRRRVPVSIQRPSAHREQSDGKGELHSQASDCEQPAAVFSRRRRLALRFGHQTSSRCSLQKRRIIGTQSRLCDFLHKVF